LHSFPEDADFIVSASIAIKGDGMSEITSQFHGLKEFIALMVPDPSIISFVTEGHNLCIGANISSWLRMSNILEKHEEIIKKV